MVNKVRLKPCSIFKSWNNAWIACYRQATCPVFTVLCSTVAVLEVVSYNKNKKETLGETRPLSRVAQCMLLPSAFPDDQLIRLCRDSLCMDLSPCAARASLRA